MIHPLISIPNAGRADTLLHGQNKAVFPLAKVGERKISVAEAVNSPAVLDRQQQLFVRKRGLVIVGANDN